MLIPLSDGWAIVVGSVMWAVISVAVGYAMHRAPVARFSHDNAVTRLRPFEADGRFYERVTRIRRWKRYLPEGGDFYEGGFNKRHLRGRTDAHLQRFVAETRRAEMTHWVVMWSGPVFWVWSTFWLGWIMVGFGVVANLPCIIAQRYNRARLLRVLSRRQRRSGPATT
jgi:glycosyl-4,4'-diaponeurosporenoate acyltransferase